MTSFQEQVIEQTSRRTQLDGHNNLVVWNDDVNTFDWVIESLMEVCGHTLEQADQCAHLVHFKGKYAVKTGPFRDLRPLCEALLERGLTASID